MRAARIRCRLGGDEVAVRAVGAMRANAGDAEGCISGACAGAFVNTGDGARGIEAIVALSPSNGNDVPKAEHCPPPSKSGEGVDCGDNGVIACGSKSSKGDDVGTGCPLLADFR